MAIIFAENSEHGNPPNYTFLWDSYSGAPAINSTNPIKGIYDIRVGRNGQNVDNMTLTNAGGPIPGFLGTTTIVYAHFWFKNVTAPPSAGNEERVLDVSDDKGNYHRLIIDENRRLYWVGSAATYFQLVASRAEELEVCVSLSAGRLYATLWVNGTLVSRYDIAAPGSPTYLAQLIFGNLSAVSGKFNYDAYYDDIVVDTATRIGIGLTLETEFPTSDDGTEDEWLRSDTGAAGDTYILVDDTPLTLGTYAWCVPGSGDATSQEQLWAFPATTALGTVLAVDCLFSARVTSPGGSVVSCYHRIKLGATAVNTDIASQISTAEARYFRRCRATDPDGAALTKANADALLVGGQRGADANAYGWKIYDVWKTLVIRDPPKDWAGNI